MINFFIGASSSATIILAILGIYHWHTSKINLKGIVKRNTIFLPSSLNKTAINLMRIDYQIRKLIPEDNDSDRNTHISNTLDNTLIEIEKYRSIFDRSVVCSELELQNSGHDEVKNLEVRAENAILIEIETDGVWKELNTEHAPNFLRPNENRKYRIWQESWLNKKIEVFQDRGKASIIEYKFSDPKYHDRAKFWIDNKALVISTLVFILLSIITFISRLTNFFDSPA